MLQCAPFRVPKSKTPSVVSWCGDVAIIQYDIFMCFLSTSWTFHFLRDANGVEFERGSMSGERTPAKKPQQPIIITSDVTVKPPKPQLSVLKMAGRLAAHMQQPILLNKRSCPHNAALTTPLHK